MVNSTALISEALSANRMTGKNATKDSPITVSQRRSFGEFLESKQLCLVNSTEPWRKNIFLAKFLDANSISHEQTSPVFPTSTGCTHSTGRLQNTGLRLQTPAARTFPRPVSWIHSLPHPPCSTGPGDYTTISEELASIHGSH